MAMLSLTDRLTMRAGRRLLCAPGRVSLAIVGFFVAVGCALALAGPAASAPAGSPSLAAALLNAEQVKSGRLSVTISARKDGQSVALIVDRFAFDLPRRLSAVTLDYSRLLRLDPSLDPGVKPGDLVIHIVFDGRHHALYLGSPLFLTSKVQSTLPVSERHREWLKYSPGAVRSAPGLSKGLRQRLLNVLNGIAASPLDAFSAVSPSPSATEAGGLVDGVATTEFATTANMSEAGALGGDVSGIVRAAGPQWSAGVWVDSNSVIRKVQFVSAPVQKASNVSFVVTCLPHALGAPVKITVPRPAQVIAASAPPR